MNESHDPREFIRGLQQILISNKKRIGFLCGAGTSMAVEKRDKEGKIVYTDSTKRIPESLIPGIQKMTEVIRLKITEDKPKAALIMIKEEIENSESDKLKKKYTFTLENIISTIDQKIKVIGKGNLCGLDKSELIDLRTIIIEEVRKIISFHDNPNIKLDYNNFLHSKLARWIINATREYPIEIFTTNYDYLFEIGLESNNLSYFDGFVGSFNPFFDPISVENDALIPRWTRLWKLHGSLGWGYNDTENKIIRSRNLTEDGLVIYPSLAKYDDSRKQPYLSYIDRLSTFLKKDDGVLFVCGYSFGDDHINETIVNSVAQSKNSTIIAFIHSNELDEKSSAINIGKRSRKISVCGSRNALIGGIYGGWRLKREPAKDDFDFIDQFFDRDAPVPSSDKGKNDEVAQYSGTLKLTDFSQLVNFLISLSYSDTYNES